MELVHTFWKGKSVFLTGHTGFKGGWLAIWLNSMGAKVHGYALHPITNPNFFNESQVEKCLSSSTIADICDLESLQSAIHESNPEIVIHMAAQPLVRESYSNPIDTYAINVMGTVNLFESIQSTPSVKVVVNITTDKCYENKEWVWPYRENEPMGGHDPYSSSKACSELITSSYRRSFFSESNIQLASVRSGNVIGGGDWSKDRLIPDFLHSLDARKELVIRSPKAVRPWQHVLEPLSGYLMLAEKLYNNGKSYAEAWNFGSDFSDSKTVEWIASYLCDNTSGSSWKLDSELQPHEAEVLMLDSAKAKTKLGWEPKWNIEKALEKTLEWHHAWKDGAQMRSVSLQQIKDYESAMKS